MAALLVGCSDPVAGTADSGAACPDGGTYPCGPYGTALGQVAAELSFSGFMDAGHLCEAPAAQQADLTALRKVSFADWYGAAATCAAGSAPRLLWINTAAGWCPACSAEALDIQASINSGALDPRVAVLSVVFETKAKGQPADAAFLKLWASTYKIQSPVVMDPSFAMGAFYSATETPFNMLLDLSDMTVIYRRTGSNLTGLKAAIAAALK